VRDLWNSFGGMKAKLVVLSCLSLGTLVVYLASTQTRKAKVDLKSELFPVLLEGSMHHLTIEAMMERFKVPGLSVALIDNYELQWSGSFGLASKKENNEVRPSTLFQTASMSKSIASLVALRLVEKGLFRLDEEIDSLLQGWSLKEAGRLSDSITLRDLMQMISGLDTPGYPGYALGDPLPTLIQILRGESPAKNPGLKLAKVPETEYSYSGGGFEVLELLLESVSELDLQQLAYRELFQPLGMQDSYFLQPLPPHLAEHAAEAHDAEGQPFKEPWRIYPELAAAGLWSTAHDLALALIAIAQGFKEGEIGFLTPQLLRALVRPHPHTSYSLGFVLGGSGKGTHIMKLGQNAGFQGWLILFPFTGQGMIILGNSDRARELSEHILQAVARKRNWPGRFELQDGPTLRK
jgi:CubicO group peptidase (beta-lactamase class C family)